MEPKKKYWNIYESYWREIKDEIKGRILTVPLDERFDVYQEILLNLMEENLFKMEKELKEKNPRIGKSLSQLSLRLNELSQMALGLKQKFWTDVHGR